MPIKTPILLIIVAGFFTCCEREKGSFDLKSLPESHDGWSMKNAGGQIHIQSLDGRGLFKVNGETVLGDDQLLERVEFIAGSIFETRIEPTFHFFLEADFSVNEFSRIAMKVKNRIKGGGDISLVARPREDAGNKEFDQFSIKRIHFLELVSDKSEIQIESDDGEYTMEILEDHFLWNGKKIRAVENMREKLRTFHDAIEFLEESPILQIRVEESVGLQRFVDVLDYNNNLPGRVIFVCPDRAHSEGVKEVD